MATPRVVIVGAGPAGVRAAETFVAAGLRPIVVDEARAAGGQIYRRQPANFRRTSRELYGSEAAKADDLHRTFERLRDHIEHRSESLAWNLRDGRLHVVRDDVSEAVAFDALVVASGATDRVFPVPGWTRPGVYTLGAAQIALKAQGCAIGARIVFAGTGPLLYLVAAQYLKAGAKIAAVVDSSSLGDSLRGLPGMAALPKVLLRGALLMAELRLAGVPIVQSAVPVAFDGDDSGVTVARFRRADGRELVFDCDAVGFGHHLRAETQLADLAGCDFAFDAVKRQWLPVVDDHGRSSVDGVYLAGDGVRLAGADAAEISGALAARATLADLGIATDERETRALLARQRRLFRFRDGVFTAFPWPGARLAETFPDDGLVCRCEAITAGALRHTVTGMGAPEVNRAKSFSRVGMGRCQGRFCGLASAEIVAAAGGFPIDAVGRLRGQAPVKPLPASTRTAP